MGRTARQSPQPPTLEGVGRQRLHIGGIWALCYPRFTAENALAEVWHVNSIRIFHKIPNLPNPTDLPTVNHQAQYHHHSKTFNLIVSLRTIALFLASLMTCAQR